MQLGVSMKVFISRVATLLLIAMSVVGAPQPASAEPALDVPWAMCQIETDTFCIDSYSLNRQTLEPIQFASLNLNLEVLFTAGLYDKRIQINLLKGNSQSLPEELVGAALTLKLRTGTWHPSNEIRGDGGYVSYKVEKTGQNFTISTTLTIQRKELNEDCTIEKCDVVSNDVLPAYLQAYVLSENPNVISQTLMSSAQNVQDLGWSLKTASYSLLLSQPTNVGLQMQTVIGSAYIAKSLGTTPSYVAKNFKAVVTSGTAPVGTATMQAVDQGLLVKATTPAGGILKLTISPKTLLPKPVLTMVKYVSKTKQTIVVKPNKAATSLYLTCYADGRMAEFRFSTKSFTFSPPTPKGEWICELQLVNGYRGPSYQYITLYNR